MALVATPGGAGGDQATIDPERGHAMTLNGDSGWSVADRPPAPRGWAR